MTGVTLSDRVTIVHGDAYELVNQWPDHAALVTDPPYGIDWCHNGGVRGSKAAVGITKHANARGCRPIQGDDRPFDPAPFLRFEWILMWGADHYRARLPAGGTMIAWDKNPRENGPADSFADGEFAWCNRRVKRNVFRMLWKGLACDRLGEENGIRHHPMLKPQRLCRWCIRTLELPPDTLIIDPFMGAGSMGIAAFLMGYRHLGVEIDAIHFATARRRLERATAQHVFNFPISSVEASP